LGEQATDSEQSQMGRWCVSRILGALTVPKQKGREA
jgi:hypothetical protein